VKNDYVREAAIPNLEPTGKAKCGVKMMQQIEIISGPDAVNISIPDPGFSFKVMNFGSILLWSKVNSFITFISYLFAQGKRGTFRVKPFSDGYWTLMVVITCNYFQHRHKIKK